MTDINSLTMIALKCAPFVFDLSSDMTHASIRDQVVRARLLVRDLTSLQKKPTSVLVVGAGFAGASAALAFAKAGIHATLVDANAQPFQLQRGVTDRYVAPLLYEWPHAGADNQTYPPATEPEWKDDSILSEIWGHGMTIPLDAATVADLATVALIRIAVKHSDFIHVRVSANTNYVSSFVKDFAKNMAVYKGMANWKAEWRKLNIDKLGLRWREFGLNHIPDIDTIVLGGGMGPELTTLDIARPPITRKNTQTSDNKARIAAKNSNRKAIEGTPFWRNDGWLTASADDRVGIFGAGDGALQDALRALTGHPHPLVTLDAIRSHAQANIELTAAEPLLLAIEQEGRLSATWTQIPEDGAKAKHRRIVVDARIDNCCFYLAQALSRKPGMTHAISSILRDGTGTVTHIFREHHYMKAYLLNRFLLHLIAASQHRAGTFPGKVRYSVIPGMTEIYGEDKTASGSGYEVFANDGYGNFHNFIFHRVSVRFGVDAKKTPGRQMLGLTNPAIAERTCLGQVPYPFVAFPVH
jgi:hypothetical protein